MSLATTQWMFGGINLQNGRAWNVRLLSPSEALSRRGDNVVVPGISGQAHVAKDWEQRQLTLALVVTGEARPGQAPSGQALAANLDILSALFGASGQQTLTRTRGLRAETAQAECVSLNVVPRGPVHADLIADLWLADPLWYATTVTSATTPFSSVPTNLALTNPGSVANEKAIITVACPASPAATLTNPKFTIGSLWVKYTGVVAAGTSLVIDVGAFTATNGGSSVIQDITWSGAQSRWMIVPVGASTLVLSADGISNTPTLTVALSAAYV